MKPNGYICEYGDAVVLDTPFEVDGQTMCSTWITVATAGGKISYVNEVGQTFIVDAFIGYNPIAAKQINTTGTTATGLGWLAGGQNHA